jgi:HNH endonuclease
MLESKEHPGYYEIPGYTEYVVAVDSTVLNKRTGEIVPGHMEKGYHRICAYKPKTDTWGSVGVHRLVCLAFNTVPEGHDVADLHTNHINGIRSDNRQENLEFVTPGENARHAFRIGLNKRAVMRTVVVRCEKTGEEKRYESHGLCAADMGLNAETVRQRLATGPNSVWAGYYRFRNEDDGDDFPFLSREEIQANYEKHRAPGKNSVVCLNVLTGEQTHYVNATECAIAHRIAGSVMLIRLGKGNSKLWKKTYRFRYLDDEDFTQATDPLPINQRPIIVRDIRTNTDTRYENSDDCAIGTGLSKNGPKVRLTLGSQHVWESRYRYRYADEADFGEAVDGIGRHGGNFLVLDRDYKPLAEYNSLRAMGGEIHMSSDTIVVEMKEPRHRHGINKLLMRANEYYLSPAMKVLREHTHEVQIQVANNGIVDDDGICVCVYDDELPDLTAKDQFELIDRLRYFNHIL